jgi:hypothetical protein
MTRPPNRPNRPNQNSSADRPERPRRPPLHPPNEPIPQIKGESPQALEPSVRAQKPMPPSPQIAEDEAGFGDWIEQNSYALVSWVGYGLLGLALLDFFFTLVPPRLFNPAWQLDAVTQLVGKVWAPLLGLMLIFFRGRSQIGELEVKILGWVSWLPMLFAIVYFLLIPATITNSMRLDQINRNESNNQMVQQTQQLSQLQERVAQASTPQEFGAVIAQLNRLPGIPRIDPNQLETLQQELIGQIEEQKVNIERTGNTNIKISQRRLLKNAARQISSTLLAGVLFIKVWQLSNWARQYHNIVRNQ